MSNEQEEKNSRLYILLAISIASFLISLLWFYFNRGFQPILAALASLAILGEIVTLNRRKWILATIIFIGTIVLASSILLVRNFETPENGNKEDPVKLTVRSTDEVGNPINRAKVLLFFEGAPFSQYTDVNGVAVFTTDSNHDVARIIVESSGYQYFEQTVSLSRNQNIDIQLDPIDKNDHGVIVRVVNNTNDPIAGAVVVLVVEGKIFEDITDSNGLSRFTIQFNERTIDAELQVTTDDYETQVNTVTLQPEHVQDIRLNPLTNELTIAETEAIESSDLTTSDEEGSTPTLSTVSTPTPTWIAPSVVADDAQSSEISGELAQNIRLTLAHSPFYITRNLVVRSGATLIIDPGVVVKFAPGQGLLVDGALIARGTVDNPIIFTSLKDDLEGDTNADGSSSAPNPGDWRALIFRDASVDTSSIVENSIVRYAGSNNEGAIHFESASPTIVNNLFENNRSYALSADVASFPTVGNNTMEGNHGNGMEIRAGTFTTSGDWENKDTVYSVTGIVNIGESATLTIHPGITVKFSDNAFIDVFGTLKVQGSPEERIVLTSIKDDSSGGDTNGDHESSAPAAGDWTMLRFNDSSNDSSCVIEHAVIRYAGENRGNRFGAIHLVAASPSISNNLFSDNYWYAISTDVNSFPHINKNELVHNTGNGLEVRSGEMISGGTWDNTDIVYVVTGPIAVNNSATLTIAPGTIVKFVENAHINVHGSLRSIGTADQKVVLTSQKDDTYGGDTNNDGNSSAPNPGDWTMIRFYDDSNDANCIIDHTVIKYAGRHGNDRYGAVHILHASPTISNSTITESFFYGIWYDADSTPNLSNNALDGNAQGTVFQQSQ